MKNNNAPNAPTNARSNGQNQCPAPLRSKGRGIGSMSGLIEAAKLSEKRIHVFKRELNADLNRAVQRGSVAKC